MTTNLKVTRFATKLQYSMLALVFMNVCPSYALAQTHSQMPATQQHEMTREQQNDASALLKIVRDSTERFKDVAVAEAEGYVLQFGCVSGADSGAMGLHYVNGNIVTSGILDATRPQIVIYEPMPNGKLKLIGADYLVIADSWDKKNRGRLNSWDSSSICSRAPIASGFRRSTRCTSGPGKIIQMARS